MPGAQGSYSPDILLSAVEPSTAELLELSRLSGFNGKLQYFPSRNRQFHTWMGYERKDPRSMPLKRAFVRYGHPLLPFSVSACKGLKHAALWL